MQQHQLVESTSIAGREVQLQDDRVVPVARSLLFFPLKEKVAVHDVKKIVVSSGNYNQLWKVITGMTGIAILYFQIFNKLNIP